MLPDLPSRPTRSASSASRSLAAWMSASARLVSSSISLMSPGSCRCVAENKMGKDFRPSPSCVAVGAAFGRAYSLCWLRGEGGLGLFGDLSKRSDVVHGDVGQGLAVQLDAGLQQAVHEAAVAHAVHAGGRIDADDPQR